MSLAINLSHPIIEAAKTLHDHCEEWKLQERTFKHLHMTYPDFGDEATLLKLAAVNGLYNTRENEVTLAAKHMMDIIPGILSSLKNIENFDARSAIEELATFVVDKNKPPRHCESLASKFAHFFIRADLFPIYDSYASRMVNYHLRGDFKNICVNKTHPYRLFYQDFIELKRFAPKSCNNRELDWYLWMRGQIKANTINGMLTRLFAMPEVANEVKVLKDEDA